MARREIESAFTEGAFDPPEPKPPEANSAAEAEDTEESSGRRMDPELRTISAVLRLLEALGEPARGRVMAYLTARYAEQQ